MAKLVSDIAWNKYRNIIRKAHDSFNQELVIWRRAVRKVSLFNEDSRYEHFDPIELRALIGFNTFRTWPITTHSRTQSGEQDNQNMVLYFNKDYLAELGYLNSEGYFDFDPSADLFVVQGLLYKPEGDTSISQAGEDPLHQQIVLRRVPVKTGEVAYSKIYKQPIVTIVNTQHLNLTTNAVKLPTPSLIELPSALELNLSTFEAEVDSKLGAIIEVDTLELNAEALEPGILGSKLAIVEIIWPEQLALIPRNPLVEGFTGVSVSVDTLELNLSTSVPFVEDRGSVTITIPSPLELSLSSNSIGISVKVTTTLPILTLTTSIEQIGIRVGQAQFINLPVFWLNVEHKGVIATGRRAVTLSLPTLELSNTVPAPNVIAGTNVIIEVPTLNLDSELQDLTVSTGRSRTVPVGMLELNSTVRPAVVDNSKSIVVQVPSLSLTTFSLSVGTRYGVSISVPVQTLGKTTFVPGQRATARPLNRVIQAQARDPRFPRAVPVSALNMGITTFTPSVSEIKLRSFSQSFSISFN